MRGVRGQLEVLTLRFDLRGSSLISIHLFKVLNLLKQNNNDVENRQNLRSRGPVDAVLANLRKSFHQRSVLGCFILYASCSRKLESLKCEYFNSTERYHQQNSVL